MTVMDRIDTPATDAVLIIIVRLLRHYCAAREDDGDGTALSRLVALGRSLRLPPAGTVALASVFQLTEAVRGRRLTTDCCCSPDLSGDERAVIRLLGSRMPTFPDTGTADIPHGLPDALAWAVLSVKWLCGGIIAIPSQPPPFDNAGCPFPHVTAA